MDTQKTNKLRPILALLFLGLCNCGFPVVFSRVDGAADTSFDGHVIDGGSSLPDAFGDAAQDPLDAFSHQGEDAMGSDRADVMVGRDTQSEGGCPQTVPSQQNEFFEPCDGTTTSCENIHDPRQGCFWAAICVPNPNRSHELWWLSIACNNQ